jgi:hypothetical protein
MNIVTFATAVSVVAPRRWIVSLYHGTCTKDSFLEHGYGVLQLLRPQQKTLVPILGKRSSYETQNKVLNDNDDDDENRENDDDYYYSKKQACFELGFEWVEVPADSWYRTHSGRSRSSSSSGNSCLEILPNCAAYIELELESTLEAGDHVLVLCQVRGTWQWDPSLHRAVALDEAGTTTAVTTTHFDHDSALYTGQLRLEGII